MNDLYFITATGTDAGKTFVAEGLARAWRARGRAVRAFKPVMTGYAAAALAASDAGRLLAACGEPVNENSVEAVSPWCYPAPLSPDRAAALAGIRIPFDGMVSWCRREVLRSEDAALVEGIGGVMTPLDANHTVRDWIAALDIPVLLVAGTYLGAISHALTALEALRIVDVRPAALILNESVGGVGIADTLASLEPHVGGMPMAALTRGDMAPGFDALVDLLAGRDA